MLTLKLSGLLSCLAILGSIGAGPAKAEYICYPYADGAPGGYNKITHACNPLYTQWHGSPNVHFYWADGQNGKRHGTLYGPNLKGNHPVAGHKY